jgi:hypothetical protein
MLLRIWLLSLVLAIVVVAPAAAATTPATTTSPVAGSTTVPGVAPATITTTVDFNALTRPETLDMVPQDHQRSGREVLNTASRLEKIRKERTKYPGSTADVFMKGPLRWQVSFYDKQRHEIGQVLIDDASGAVLEAWTGPQVAWTMARGYPGAFGRKAAAVYVWIPLLILFLVPFIDWRHPLRMRHLDLAALCSLSISLAFFSNGNLAWSVPTTYPPLIYLVLRLLYLGLRRDAPAPKPYLLGGGRGLRWLAIATIFLVGFRVGLNVTDSNVIDVGYSGVIGADKISHGHDLYGNWPSDDASGDTYGPVNYLVYVPFEAVWPWHGSWDDLPAAHAAAIFFDLLCLGGMFLLGRRIRGPSLGIVLTYAWAAFPFTLFSLDTNSNDGLVAALLIGVLLVASKAPARGAMAALAGLTKFAPLALVPLLATHGSQGEPWPRKLRTVALFALGFLVVAGIVMLPVWLQGDLRTFYDRTIGFQLDRGAPFSVWGYYGGLHGLQIAVQAFTVLFAIAAAFIPRRPDVIGLAAIAGAILLMLQLGTTYWFYLYVVWMVPFAFVVFFGRDAAPEESGPPAPEPEPDSAPAPPPVLAAP